MQSANAAAKLTISPLTAVGCLALLLVRRVRAACFVAAAMLATLGARLLVVNGIARPRPVDRLGPASGWSFPSGHSTAAAAAALIAVVVGWPMARSRRAWTVLVAVAAGWAVAVGASRIALVVHWPERRPRRVAAGAHRRPGRRPGAETAAASGAGRCRCR